MQFGLGLALTGQRADGGGECGTSIRVSIAFKLISHIRSFLQYLGADEVDGGGGNWFPYGVLMNVHCFVVGTSAIDGITRFPSHLLHQRGAGGVCAIREWRMRDLAGA